MHHAGTVLPICLRGSTAPGPGQAIGESSPAGGSERLKDHRPPF